MSCAARVVSLFLLSFFVMGASSCQTLSEPNVYICTIIDGVEADCINSIDNTKTHTLTVDHMIGFQCVAPIDYGRIKTHHEMLHKEISGH